MVYSSYPLHIQGLGKTSIWDEKDFSGIYTGTAEGCNTFECATQSVIEGKIPFGSDGGEYYYNLEGGDSDVKTHAFWAKDEDSKDGYLLARELAIQHVLKEVETLWTRSETLGDLQDIFGMTYSQLEERRVLYKNTDKCDLCPF